MGFPLLFLSLQAFFRLTPNGTEVGDYQVGYEFTPVTTVSAEIREHPPAACAPIAFTLRDGPRTFGPYPLEPGTALGDYTISQVTDRGFFLTRTFGTQLGPFALTNNAVLQPETNTPARQLAFETPRLEVRLQHPNGHPAFPVRMLLMPDLPTARQTLVNLRLALAAVENNKRREQAVRVYPDAPRIWTPFGGVDNTVRPSPKNRRDSEVRAASSAAQLIDRVIRSGQPPPENPVPGSYVLLVAMRLKTDEFPSPEIYWLTHFTVLPYHHTTLMLSEATACPWFKLLD